MVKHQPLSGHRQVHLCHGALSGRQCNCCSDNTNDNTNGNTNDNTNNNTNDNTNNNTNDNTNDNTNNNTNDDILSHPVRQMRTIQLVFSGGGNVPP